MLSSKDEIPRILIPVASALILTLLFFVFFDRWNETENPINSIVTPILGTGGFAIGVAVDRWRARRSRGQGSGTDATA